MHCYGAHLIKEVCNHDRFAGPVMNVRVQRVATSRVAQIVSTTRLAVIRKTNRVAVFSHPVTDGREYLHRLERNRAVLSWSNVQKIISTIARARDQVAN